MWTVPENTSLPGQAEVDDLRCSKSPRPLIWVLCALLLPIAPSLAEDAFEVDNTPLEAHAADVGGWARHDFHTSNDVDWVKFYCLTNFLYEISTTQVGTNVDTVLDVYQELPDGTLNHMFTEDSEGKGTNYGEMAWLTNPQAGIYYMKVSGHGPDEYGADSEYDLRVWVPATPDGVLLVACADKLNPSSSPAGAQAIVDGVSTKSFNGATTVEFLGLAPGTYTVRVTVPSAGYRPEEDPAAPDQVNDPSSYLYGNPKTVQVLADRWQVAIFQYVPYIRVDGILRDAWTGVRLQGARVQFEALNGVISGITYDGYPNNAVYETNWYSLADGTLPTNVWLPAVDWKLTISSAGYSNKVLLSCITNASVGDSIDLGKTTVHPVDADANGLADAWEETYFPGEDPDPDDDPDNDGMKNKGEYVAGTNPKDAGDVLRVSECDMSASFRMVWPVVPARTYQVSVSTNLSASLWPEILSSAVEATNDQSYMEWIDTNTVDRARFYGIKVVVP